MRKIFLVIFLSFLMFTLEYLFFEVLGKMFQPNLMLILIVFIDLSFGSRFSLLSAFAGGFLKDSFSTNSFGLNVFSFGVTALAITIFRNYCYRKGSEGSRFLIVAIAVLINTLCQYFLRLMHAKFGLWEVVKNVFLPEMFFTLLISLITINILRRCVSRLFAW